MRHPGYDLTTHYVVLVEDLMTPEYRTPEWRVVRVCGGFGAKPGLIGRAIIVQHHDGDDYMVTMNDIERLATATEIHTWSHRWDEAHDIAHRCVFGRECDVQ